MKLGECCPHCGLTATERFVDPAPGDVDQVYDPCIGRLPGVDYGCCGHGVLGDGYLLFSNGTLVRFDLYHIQRMPSSAAERMARNRSGLNHVLWEMDI